MKTIHRVLAIVGMVVLVVAVTGVLMARHYRRAYTAEREARQVLVTAASGFFIGAAQDNLLKASLAVSRENFEAAREEAREARRIMDSFERMPFAREVRGDIDLNAIFNDAETELARLGPDSQKKLINLINLLVEMREGARQ